MKTFDEIYNELQNNNELNQIYQEALEESKKGKKISGILCIIIDIIVLILFLKFGIKIIPSNRFFCIYVFYFLFCVLGIDIIIFAIVNIFFYKYQGEYKKKYKEIVINKIMNNFYNNLEYFPNKKMPEYIYKEDNYDLYYDNYESDDYFEAEIDDKYSIQMAEILTKEIEIYKDSDGETQTRVRTLFHGLFGKIVMHKSIMGELKIAQNGKLMFDKKLKMDSSEFEKYFDVKASDKIMGMRLLTADVMEELVQFENKTNVKFDIFIKENELYLRFHSGPMFEATALDKEKIKKYFYMLNFTYNLANKLIKVVDETIL